MILPYQDHTLNPEERINDLVTRMTLEEKIRQLDHYAGGDFTSITNNNMEIVFEKLGNICGGLGFGAIQNRGGNANINNKIQKFVIENTRLGIPVLFAEEGLHGFFYSGCTVFPQQLMLASTFSPELAEQTGHAIAFEAAALGVHEVWAPVLEINLLTLFISIIQK
jgi:beta-glucosidase